MLRCASGLIESFSLMKSWITELQKTAILAFPMVLNQVSQHLIQVIDAAMIGRVGVIPLAASAFASSVFTIPIVFCYGLTLVVSILVSSAYGEEDQAKANHVLRVGLVVSTLVAVLLAGAFMLAAPMLSLFGQSQEVLEQAGPYYLLLLGSLVPAIIFACHKNYMEAMNRPWLPLLVTIGMLLANVGLNWVFIFGRMGIPAMGLTGAGIATLIARILAALALIAMVALGARWQFRFLSMDWFRIRLFEVREYLTLGLASGFQLIFEVSAFVFAAIMMGWISEATLAAHQIAINVAASTFMVVLGISFATTVRVGQFLGRRDYVGLRRAGWVGWFANVTFMSTCMVALILTRNVIPTWFVVDPEVIVLAAGLLVIAGLFQVFDGVQIAMMSSLRGMRDVKVPTVIVMFVYYGVCLPLAYVLAFKFGWDGTGIWVGLATGLALSAVLLTVRFHWKSMSLVRDGVTPVRA